jgi:hypothetical protein
VDGGKIKVGDIVGECELKLTPPNNPILFPQITSYTLYEKTF